jgi:choline dehydrogenase-like flavoprotein
MMGQSIPGGDAIVLGGKLSRGFDDVCDVAVVGSGSGGSVVAALLAEAGHRVIILEEGPYYAPDEYAKFSPTEGLRRLWREAGLLAAFGVGDTPIIALATGRCVGGSSVLTGGVCFRIPPEVHHLWVRDLGLFPLSEKALEPAYEDVEKRLDVQEVPASLRSHATRRLVDGAESIGIPMKSIRRNIRGCQGNAQCNSGCPAEAKRSVDVAYLPAAFEHGARVVSDALVERVILEDGAARGVVGRLFDVRTGKPGHRFRVRAKVVVLAAGTLHTPVILRRSGVDHPALGNHVTVHPAVRVCAQFDDPVDGHVGAMQPVYSDHLASDGLTIVGVHPPPNILAAALPGIGAAHRARIRKIRGLGSIGGMVHDAGGGSVRTAPGREPVLWYRMAPRDLARVRRLITVLGEIAFAAGAKTLYPPVFGITGIRSRKELLRLEHEPLDPRRIECMAFHPLGSARMAATPRGGPVSLSGEVRAARGLYVADGSILPTSIGVNSQIAVLAMATRIAWGLREDDRLLARHRQRTGLGAWWDKATWHIRT